MTSLKCRRYCLELDWPNVNILALNFAKGEIILETSCSLVESISKQGCFCTFKARSVRKNYWHSLHAEKNINH